MPVTPAAALTRAGTSPGPPAAPFVLRELDELIHHGAEVGVLRDLFRAGAR